MATKRYADFRAIPKIVGHVKTKVRKGTKFFLLDLESRRFVCRVHYLGVNFQLVNGEDAHLLRAAKNYAIATSRRKTIYAYVGMVPTVVYEEKIRYRKKVLPGTRFFIADLKKGEAICQVDFKPGSYDWGLTKPKTDAEKLARGLKGVNYSLAIIAG